MVLAYLLVVTGAAAARRAAPGITAGLGFSLFDLLFLQPYHHVIVDDLRTTYRWQFTCWSRSSSAFWSPPASAAGPRPNAASARPGCCSELSTSLVTHGSPRGHPARVVRTVRSLFDLAGCAIVLPSGSGSGLHLAAVDGQVPGEHDERVPMRSGGQALGRWWWAGGPGSSGFGEPE